MQDHIAGVEASEHDPPAHIQPRPLASPPNIAKEEKAKHYLTHARPHPGSAICRSTRTPNLPHSVLHESSRAIPRLVGDYCFLRKAGDSTLLACLARKLYPYRLVLACGVPKKGVDSLVVSRIARCTRELGLAHCACRCGREATLTAMFEEAMSRTGRAGKLITKDTPSSDCEFPVAGGAWGRDSRAQRNC